MKKRILILSLSDIKNDPRVYRQIKALAGDYNVVAAGYNDPRVDGVEFSDFRFRKSPLPAKLFYQAANSLKFFELCENDFAKRCTFGNGTISGRSFDLVIVNDPDALPVVFRLFKGAKIFYDAHEYAPREFEDSLFWRLRRQGYVRHVCAKYLKKVDAMTTVCAGIADEYHRNFGVRPDVVTNASKYCDLAPSPVNPDGIRIIHHGGATSSRKIEMMIEAAALLDNRFTLTLMLMPADRPYYDRLRMLAGDNKKVVFRDPVAMKDIASAANEYDIGMYLLPPISFNNRLALPNKFFEYVQARLAIAIGPSPEMAGILRSYDLGVVSVDFTPQRLADTVNALTAEKIEYYKKRAHAAAMELSEESNVAKLRKTVARLLA